MIKAVRRPLSDSENRALLNWLSHEGANVYRLIIKDRISELEADVGSIQCSNVNRETEVTEMADEARFLTRALDSIDSIRDKRKEVYRVQIAIQ